MVKILMILAKMATSALLKMKFFWNKCYYVIYSVCDVTNKFLLHDSNYIVDVVTWSKFGYSSIRIREVIITSILKGFDQKNRFFDRWSRFKFNNLGLALGTNLKFYTSLSKGLKLKNQKVLGANFYVCRSYREKTGRGGAFWCPLPPPILNRVKKSPQDQRELSNVT